VSFATHCPRCGARFSPVTLWARRHGQKSGICTACRREIGRARRWAVAWAIIVNGLTIKEAAARVGVAIKSADAYWHQAKAEIRRGSGAGVPDRGTSRLAAATNTERSHGENGTKL
jgi:hypothetical protein